MKNSMKYTIITFLTIVFVLYVIFSTSTSALASGIIDWDELMDNMILDENTIISMTGNTLTWGDDNLFLSDLVGIGTHFPTAKLTINHSVIDHTSAMKAQKVDLITTLTRNNAENAWGGYFVANANLVGYEMTGDLTGLFGGVSVTSPGLVMNAKAIQSKVTAFQGTIDKAYGFYVEPFTEIASGSITNTYGVYIDAQTVGDVNYALVTNDGTVVFNESGSISNFRIEGDTNQNLLFTDAATDRIGIGMNRPSYLLDVGGDFSAEQTFGSGLTDCDGLNDKLQWDATTGLFSCTIENMFNALPPEVDPPWGVMEFNAGDAFEAAERVLQEQGMLDIRDKALREKMIFDLGMEFLKTVEEFKLR
ncbi:MAG: hypothetical protein ABH833_03815 [Parcubacteria group bacterium]